MQTRIIILVGAILLAACGGVDSADSPLGIAPYFQDYYQQHGGIRTIGAPITVVNRQADAHVQCFQNGVLEFHPELPPNQQVFMTPLGAEYGERQSPVDLTTVATGALYFPQTGHSVQGKFRTFFEEYGGVSFFGYPISETLVASSDALIQHFERATLRYDRTLPIELNVQLASWGQQHYDKFADACTTIDSVIVQIPSTPVIETNPGDSSDPVLEFVRRFGGEQLFGQPIEANVTLEEGISVFENAVLVHDTAAVDGVRLLPLGLQARGAIDPAVAPLNLPDSTFFESTGHNLAYGFRPFYQANGGAALFGLPITEVFIENGRLVQYFENARIEWLSEAPSGSAARLSNLGQQYLASVEAGLQAESLPKPQITAESWAALPVANLDDLQTLFVRVVDEYNHPVSGAEPRMDIYAPSGVESHSLTATSDNGQAALNLPLTAFEPGARVEYDVFVHYGPLETVLRESFDISQANLP